MNPQDFLRKAANNIVKKTAQPSQLKQDIINAHKYNETTALEGTAFNLIQHSTPSALRLNQQIIKESLLPSQAEGAANAYAQNIVKNAVLYSQKYNIPVETAVQELIKTTSPKQFMGNAPQGTGALTRVTQVINNPEFQMLIDPNSPLGLSEIQALEYMNPR